MDEWKELSNEEQELFTQTSRELEERRYLIAPNQERESIELLKKQGTQVINLSDEELAAIKKKIEEKVWPLLEKEVGESFRQIISGVKDKQ